MEYRARVWLKWKKASYLNSNLGTYLHTSWTILPQCEVMNLLRKNGFEISRLFLLFYITQEH